VAEASKLLITLSTGVIAFCVAVVNVKEGQQTLLTPTTDYQKFGLVASWLLLLIATGGGVWTQLAGMSRRLLKLGGGSVTQFLTSSVLQQRVSETATA
jgi:hypothetical protein